MYQFVMSPSYRKIEKSQNCDELRFVLQKKMFLYTKLDFRSYWDSPTWPFWWRSRSRKNNFWIQSLPFKLIYDLPFTFYRIETFRLTSYSRIFPNIFPISSLQQSIVECSRKGNENNWNKKAEKMKIWSGKFKFISFFSTKKPFSRKMKSKV